MKRFLIIIADRQVGRYFTTYGDMHENDEEIIESDVPQKVKAHGFRVGKIDRHIRDHLYRHLKHVGLRAFEYVRFEMWKIDGVIVGGHNEMHSTIINCLPSELAKNVVGTFVADTDMTLDELTQRAFHAVHHTIDTAHKIV